MSKEIITFGSVKLENLILLDDVDIDNILISSLVSSGEKNYK